MAKNDFQYGGWNSCILQCGTITTLFSPGDCTLQCGSWNRDSEFTKWQHPAMWYVALGWHAIEFAQTSTILEFYMVSISTTSPQSTCHSAPVSEILCTVGRKKWRHVDIQDGESPPSWKNPCTTSYRSLGDTIALNCLVFEIIAYFCIFGDRQSADRLTNKRTDGQHRCTKPLSLLGSAA